MNHEQYCPEICEKVFQLEESAQILLWPVAQKWQSKTILAIHCHERFHCMYVILVGLLVFRRMHSYSHLILLSV